MTWIVFSAFLSLSSAPDGCDARIDCDLVEPRPVDDAEPWPLDPEWKIDLILMQGPVVALLPAFGAAFLAGMLAATIAGGVFGYRLGQENTAALRGDPTFDADAYVRESIVILGGTAALCFLSCWPVFFAGPWIIADHVLWLVGAAVRHGVRHPERGVAAAVVSVISVPSLAIGLALASVPLAPLLLFWPPVERAFGQVGICGTACLVVAGIAGALWVGPSAVLVSVLLIAARDLAYLHAREVLGKWRTRRLSAATDDALEPD